MKEIQTIIGNTKAGIAIVGLMLIGLVSSCSSGDGADADEQQWAAGAQIAGVSSYMTGYMANTQTRAWAIPDGYEPYEGGEQPIGVWFTKNSPSTTVYEGYLYKSGEKWRANFKEGANLSAETYYVYGYIPHSAGISGSVTPGSESLYANGATLTLTNVPSVMPNDLCVIIGAKDGTDKENDNGLRRGDFAYAAKATSSEDSKGNYVFLLFDHLYSAIRVNMKVYADYNNLRTIKLKSLKLSTKVDDTYSKDHTDIAIVLEATDGSDPIQSITYIPTSTAVDNKDGIEFWKSESSEGQTLTTSFQPFTGHFMPTGITTLVLTSVYDVYDKKGNLLRDDFKVTNTMVLKDLLTEQTTTKRGYRYTINMTIQPTYLYMLSEPDLDNPTVVLEP